MRPCGEPSLPRTAGQKATSRTRKCGLGLLSSQPRDTRVCDRIICTSEGLIAPCIALCTCHLQSYGKLLWLHRYQLYQFASTLAVPDPGLHHIKFKVLLVTLGITSYCIQRSEVTPPSMPKEQIRKRGRRKPKAEDEFAQPKPEIAAPVAEIAAPVEQEVPQAGPSGLHPDRVALLSGRRPAPRQLNDDKTGEGGQEGAAEEQGEQQPWGRQFGLNEEFPFGELDPDLKGYFRTVEDQVKDWEGTSSEGEQREGELMLQLYQSKSVTTSTLSM